MRIQGFSAATVVIALISLRTATGACPVDWSVDGALRGVNGSVNSLYSWDADGPGGGAPLLIAGGVFTVAGDVPARNIAAWDGQHWHALGNGLASDVRAISSWNGRIIAATYSGSTSRVFAWDGIAWTQLGGVFNSIVRALAVFDGALIIGGSFQVVDETTLRGLGTWNGVEWVEFAGGAIGGGVNSLFVDGSALYAGGAFSAVGSVNAVRIARYGSGAWAPLGTGAASTVTSIARVGATLFVATGAGVTGFDGVQWTGTGGLSPPAAQLAVRDGRLFAAGQFTSSAYGNFVSSYNGNSWSAPGGGLGLSASAICEFNNEIVVGGAFLDAGGAPVGHIAAWNGAAWHALGAGWGIAGSVPPELYCFAKYQGSLIAGGSFASTPGGVGANLARRVDGVWTPFTVGQGPNRLVNAVLVAPDQRLVIGGAFTAVDGIPAPQVAAWDGGQWAALGPGFGGPPTTSVYAAVVHNGSLYVGGNFTSLNDGAQTPMKNIARWDGVGFQPVGNGTNASVSALISYDHKLIAAGRFSLAGATPAGLIAAWDGMAWTALDSGLAGPTSPAAHCLAINDNELYAGGVFTSAGGIPVSNVARWDGEHWHSVGDLTGGAVITLAANNHRIYAGGFFTASSVQPLSRIARLGQTGWEAIGDVDNAVWALEPIDGVLRVGGTFNLVTDQGVSRVSACYAEVVLRCPGGDADCSGEITDFDIDPFVLALVDADAYAALHPDCPASALDANHDGRFDNFDIDPFVTCLVSGCP